jgi:hypothetical protein
MFVCPEKKINIFLELVSPPLRGFPHQVFAMEGHTRLLMHLSLEDLDWRGESEQEVDDREKEEMLRRDYPGLLGPVESEDLV